MAAAAWSWVEKMLQLAQRTLAPSSTRVSIKTAVWIVMCREPVMRTPFRGFVAECLCRIARSPGISFSAMVISLRPQSANDRSATFIIFVFGKGHSLHDLSTCVDGKFKGRILAIAGQCREAKLLAERSGLIRLFPREGIFRSSEVAISGGRAINRTAQLSGRSIIPLGVNGNTFRTALTNVSLSISEASWVSIMTLTGSATPMA